MIKNKRVIINNKYNISYIGHTSISRDVSWSKKEEGASGDVQTVFG